ncbi:hypothetical protein CYMTET_52355 [Cymbomonas tetramitiformis]|uniref:Uncharacterized protein n=1 Tax=Cymbomonas tetramitiformis TaxID=36881 RepID=A0AAE0BJ81_9CHLO|nr:hypothetical protein CYMTET_52355 [Cymbomonas tetramitiformis]
MQLLKQFTSELHDRDMLMKVAFKGIGGLGMKTVTKNREVGKLAVEEEQVRRQIRHPSMKKVNAQSMVENGNRIETS